jgi:hypothetical protein
VEVGGTSTKQLQARKPNTQSEGEPGNGFFPFTGFRVRMTLGGGRVNDPPLQGTTGFASLAPFPLLRRRTGRGERKRRGRVPYGHDRLPGCPELSAQNAGRKHEFPIETRGESRVFL